MDAGDGLFFGDGNIGRLFKKTVKVQDFHDKVTRKAVMTLLTLMQSRPL
jgi:hypothetical protein